MGCALDIIIYMPKPSTGTAQRNTVAIRAFILNDIIRENISISGLRIAIRMSIMYACCILVTSVVSLVIRLAVENLSILAKENV